MLAILKVVWALVIGRYLMCIPENKKPIIHVKPETNELSFILKAPIMFFVYAGLLIISLFVAFIFTRPVKLAEFSALVTISLAGATGMKTFLQTKASAGLGLFSVTSG